MHRHDSRQKKLEEHPDLTEEDITPILIKALVEGGFDPAEGQAVESAKLSQCGKLRARQCQKLDANCKPEKGAFQTTIDAFKTLIGAHLESSQSRAQGEIIDSACKALLPPEPVSYCAQMCETMGINGKDKSHELFGQTAGKTSQQIQEEVDSLSELGERYTQQDNKCKEATEALQGFKLTLAPLEVAITTTFNEWMKAHGALEEAEDKLEDLKDMMEEQENTIDELTQLVKAADEKLEAATLKLTQLKVQEETIKKAHELAVNKLAKTKGTVEDGESALRAAEKVKEQLAGAMESMVNMYDWFVHEPLRNLMLDDANSLKTFEPTDKEISSTSQLKESFRDLADYCEREAKPSFGKITNLNLAPLCEFGGDEAVIGVERTLRLRKDEVMQKLEECMGYSRDLSIPEEAGEVNGIVEPVLLEPLMEIYSDVDFASAYMPDWKTGGRFLKAIEELRNMLHELEQESQGLQGQITSLTDQMQENGRLRDEVSELVRQAIAEKKIADANEAQAKQLLEEQQEQQRQQEANIEVMRRLADAAYQAYKGALDNFGKVFGKGTIFLEAHQGKVISASRNLKPIKKLN